MSATHETTELLAQWASGNKQALDELTPRVYAELRQLAASYLRREPSDHSLQPTALVHEAYLRLVDQKTVPSCQNRSHFLGIAARLMRQILVDHARRRQTAKRGGPKVPLDHAIALPDGQSADILALDHSLKELEGLDARKSKSIELSYFAGLSIKEIAEALQVSAKTVSRDLAFAEAWLYHHMRSPSTRKTS
jgi:RNA polymerase sigma-70 factor, ECF subfamily